MKDSSSQLLIDNCDEFIFYEDLTATEAAAAPSMGSLPKKKASVFALLASTVRALIRENKDVLYSSMVKDTMKRKQPSFNESYYDYSTFSDLLEDARDNGIVEITRNQKAGGTYVVTGLGPASKKKSRPRKR